jgi:hypothetical protein
MPSGCSDVALTYYDTESLVIYNGAIKIGGSSGFFGPKIRPKTLRLGLKTRIPRAQDNFLQQNLFYNTSHIPIHHMVKKDSGEMMHNVQRTDIKPALIRDLRPHVQSP